MTLQWPMIFEWSQPFGGLQSEMTLESVVPLRKGSEGSFALPFWWFDQIFDVVHLLHIPTNAWHISIQLSPCDDTHTLHDSLGIVGWHFRDTAGSFGFAQIIIHVGISHGLGIWRCSRNHTGPTMVFDLVGWAWSMPETREILRVFSLQFVSKR